MPNRKIMRTVTLGMLLAGPITVWALTTQARPARELQVTVNGRPVNPPAGPLSLRAGEDAQLKVEVVESDGRRRDVTNDANTYYFVNPGLVTVSDAGRVSARAPAAGARRQAMSGLVLIAHSRGRSDDAALLTSVDVDIEYVDPNALVVSAPRTMLRVGETVKLSVTLPPASGNAADITEHPDTRYSTARESVLVVEDNGLVTAVGKDADPRSTTGIIVHHKGRSGTVQFTVLEGGPGPTLDVHVDRSILREGESAQLRVMTRGDVPPRDLTAAATGTRYLVFAGYGRVESDVLQIDVTGKATATASLGRFNRRQLVVFARNGELVGWTNMRIERAAQR